MMRALVVSVGAFTGFAMAWVLGEDECPILNPYHVYQETDQFELHAESAAGAVGDVVPVTISMRCFIDSMVGSTGMDLAICYDPKVAVPVGKPLFNDEFTALTGSIDTWPVNEDSGTLNQVGHGMTVNVWLLSDLFYGRFPSQDPLAIMTIYYRIKGNPGDVGQVTLCNGVLQRANNRCTLNQLYLWTDARHYTNYLPGLTTPGTLTVLPGPATHPDRPPDPPEAKVYSEKPTADQVNLRIRISGAAVRPGDLEVPVEVYMTADLEYASALIPIDFDERYLHLRRVQDYFMTGWGVMDNNDATPGSDVNEGNTVIYSGGGVSKTRLAAEGEEFHAATLYFDVLEAARDIQKTTLDVVKVTGAGYSIGFQNKGPWVEVLSSDSGSSSIPPVRTQVSPISIQNGVMFLVPSSLVKRGDANFDTEVDISDPVLVLSSLFLGGAEPPCPIAADFNLDRLIDISDPIGILKAIFQGEDPLRGTGPAEVPCR